MKTQVETKDDVAEKTATAKKKGRKSFTQLKEEMAGREKQSVVVKSDDLVPLDLSKMSKGECAEKTAKLQEDHLLIGWDSKTKEALIITPELADRQAVKRAKSDEIKEERGN